MKNKRTNKERGMNEWYVVSDKILLDKFSFFV